MRCSQRILRVERQHISWIRFLLEGYDGIASVTTLEPARGLIQINTAPGCEDALNELLKELAKEMLMEPVEAAPSF